MSLESLKSRVELLEHVIAIQKKKVSDIYLDHVTHGINNVPQYSIELDKLVKLQTDLIEAAKIVAACR